MPRSLLLISVLPLLHACAPAPVTPTTGPPLQQAQPAPLPLPSGGTRAQQQQAYLQAVHDALRPRWDKVRADATALLPPTHPANLATRAAQVTALLDRQGKIKQARVSQSSGFTPFDESALAALQRIRQPPALPPALRKGHVELRWALYRDQRSCGVEHAELVLHPLAPLEALTDALDQGALDQAYEVISRTQQRAPLLAALANRGVRHKLPAVRKLALRCAPPALLASMLAARQGDEIWYWLVQELSARGAVASINAELARWAGTAKGKLGAARVGALVQALGRAKGHGTAATLDKLMRSPSHEVVLAAAPAVRAKVTLDRAMARHASRLELAGPLAVHRLALGQDAAASAMFNKALGGKARSVVLQALARRPVAALLPRVEALVRSNAVPAAPRVQAIHVLSKLGGKPVPFFVALLSTDPAVRLAAVQALGQYKGNRAGICYRLAVVAKERGPVGAAALVSIARIGIPRFLPDVHFLTRAQKTPHQAQVVAALWGFGEPAVPYLARLLKHADAKLRQAAAASLARIKGDKASAALAPYRAKHPAPVKVTEDQRDELARLLRRVLALKPAAPAQ